MIILDTEEKKKGVRDSCISARREVEGRERDLVCGEEAHLAGCMAKLRLTRSSCA